MARKRRERGFRRPKITYNRRIPNRWPQTAAIVQAYRDNQGMTQETFAGALSFPWLKVSDTAVVFWEAGDTRPNKTWLDAVLGSETFSPGSWQRNMAQEIVDTGVWNIRFPAREKQA